MSVTALARAHPAHLAIFLDFDGTLVPLAARPQDVVVPRCLPGLLHRLARRGRGGVALISGRPVSVLRRFLPRAALAMRGCHGVEAAAAGGVARAVVAVDQKALSAAAERARAEMKVASELIVEQKPFGIGLHYRQAPEHAARMRDLAEALLQDLPGFTAHQGKMVIELRPKGIGKDAAVNSLLKHPTFRGRMPVFIGDDTTDEPAFAAVNARGGVSIKVGPGTSAARHRLATPEAVHRLITHWTETTT